MNDEQIATHMLIVCAMLLVWFGSSVVCFLKGKWRIGTAVLVVGFIDLLLSMNHIYYLHALTLPLNITMYVCAIRLAKPGSWWSRHLWGVAKWDKGMRRWLPTAQGDTYNATLVRTMLNPAQRDPFKAFVDELEKRRQQP
jgi:hypothetical protein